MFKPDTVRHLIIAALLTAMGTLVALTPASAQNSELPQAAAVQ